MSYADYGHNVKTLREGLGMSQSDLAYLAGCTLATINAQEQEKGGSRLYTAARVAQALGVTVDTLIGLRLTGPD